MWPCTGKYLLLGISVNNLTSLLGIDFVAMSADLHPDVFAYADLITKNYGRHWVFSELTDRLMQETGGK